MLVSHSAKFVFIHVQRTGGLSMQATLKQQFPDLRVWHGRHGHVRAGIAEWGRERWDEYHSFAVVRNPWDRLVSWYSMIRARQADNRIQLPWPLSRQPRLWDQVARRGRTFEQFLHNCTTEVFDRGCRKSFVYNQLDYLVDREGRPAVSQVARFETLGEDIDRLFAHLGIAAKLPHRNGSQHGHYSRWYDDRTEELVRQRFARDIEAFDYRFERPRG